MAGVHVKYDEDFRIGRILPAFVNFLRIHVVPAILGSIQISSSTAEETSEAQKSVECSYQESTEIPFEESGWRVTWDCQPVSFIRMHMTIVGSIKDFQRQIFWKGNSNASVGCDYPDCNGCNVRFCWPCAR